MSQSSKHPSIAERLQHQVRRVAAAEGISERDAALSMALSVVAPHLAPDEKLYLSVPS